VGIRPKDPATAAAVAAAEAEINFRRECGGNISDMIILLEISFTQRTEV
jgi:hypothetical protein